MIYKAQPISYIGLFILLVPLFVYASANEDPGLQTMPLLNLVQVVQSNLDYLFVESISKDDYNKEQEAIFATALQTANKTRILLDQIVDDFAHESSENPELGYQFKTMCTILQDVDMGSLKPCHIRAQRNAVQAFDDYVVALNHKQVFTAKEQEFANKLIALNQALMLLLEQDYFDITYVDHLIDYALFRPLEFAYNHPYLTCLIVTVTTVAVAIAYNKWRTSTEPYYPNNNKNYLVLQEAAALRQKGLDCAHYALLHSLIANNVQDQQQRRIILERAKQNPNLLQPWKNFMIPRNERNIAVQTAAGPRKDESDQDFRDRLAKMDRKDEGMRRDDISAILDNPDLVDQVIRPLLGQDVAINRENIIIVSGLLFQQDHEQHYLPLNQRLDGWAPRLEQSLNQFHNQQTAQHIILGLPPEGKIPPHAVSVIIEPDQAASKNLRARIFDSMNRNITNHAMVNHLLDTYARGHIEV